MSGERLNAEVSTASHWQETAALSEPKRGLALERPTTHNRPGCARRALAVVIRKDAGKKRLKHWTTVFCIIASSILSTGVEQNGLREKIAGLLGARSLSFSNQCLHPQWLRKKRSGGVRRVRIRVMTRNVRVVKGSKSKVKAGIAR